MEKTTTVMVKSTKMPHALRECVVVKERALACLVCRNVRGSASISSDTINIVVVAKDDVHPDKLVVTVYAS